MMVGIETVSKTEKEIYELDEAARQGYQAIAIDNQRAKRGSAPCMASELTSSSGSEDQDKCSGLSPTSSGTKKCPFLPMSSCKIVKK